ncbi:GNAT family N-acetyltransferase [Actinophytocola gossypii]|uniref:GNAT family N-acetyltransferase n=1 Tax=Actinophytocola gossypii TaxID=2812003 RepID=A0ABT2J702_9PSEU|nr:GNAT family N-acetyltransferase [Actinophytocola gossypii]MCT2583466.1 GNAT family N-acetyltransferase [Actinophytocola gossypii]
MDAVTDTTDAGATAAAAAAGVRVRELTDLADLTAVCRLFRDIWRTDPKNPLVTTELLRALTKAGNYLAGAFDGDRLVGACVGFFGAPAEGVMHSHIAGVAPAAAGRSVGFALKSHQRAWALRRGVGAIAWTFDPLVARNAYFNVVKLGATAVEYLPNFYGGMADGVNGGDDTDRLLVHWDLAGEPSGRALIRPAAVALGRAPDGGPAPGEANGSTVAVAVPPDIEALRAADPGLAKAWRVALREVLGGLLADGARIAGFDRAGWYVLTREETS